jgi:hypothetical protein
LGQQENSQENLGFELRGALSGNPDYRVSEIREADFEGTRVVFIALAYARGRGEFWVDLERGAIPLKRVIRSNGANGDTREIVAYYDDLKLIQGRGWLPFKSTTWYGSDKTAKQLLIQEANFSERPSPTSFGLEFPAETTLVDEAVGLRYPPRKVWDVNSLPAANAVGVEKVEYAASPGTAPLPLPGERGADRTELVFIGVVILALIGSLLAWRHFAGPKGKTNE